ncbi:hypothetical protein L7F22_015341 [Adiantum nelumboides]|nr:hypothetical protein [Adiantum nelumboides]
MPMLWSSKDDDRLVDEVRQGKGIWFRLTEETREKIRSYCVANAAVMEKWRDKYADARNNDASLPNVPSQSWILDAMLTAKSNGEVVSTEEMDYAYGCDWHMERRQDDAARKGRAVSTFGVGPDMYGLRIRYFLTHVVYGLACGITDPHQLPQYGKHDLMKQKPPIIEHIEEAPQIEAIEETQLLDLNMLAADADDKTHHSKRPRHKEKGPLDKGTKPKYFVIFSDD